MHLVLGDEVLLVERAVADVLRSARERAGTLDNPDVPVSRMRAGDVGTYELAELLSPSLFADERIVVLEAAAEAGKDAAAVIAAAAADVPAGTVMVLLVAKLLWRWRWFRGALGLAGVAAVMCSLAWSLSGLVGP